MTIDDISLEHVYDFMERGNINNAPEAIVQYLDRLDKIRGMFMRIDKFGSKETIVKHLMLVDGMSRYKAMQVCDEAQQYFYSDVKISKAAWRNIYAEKMEKAVNFGLLTMKDVSDAAKVVKMLADLGDMRGINLEEKDELPDSLFEAPWVVYSADAEFLGMPKPNRNKISALIDSYPELSEKEKTHLKREALILPLNIFPNEQEDARKT